MKHLTENNIGYWEHFARAMSMSIALFIHAIIPDTLPDYASNKMMEVSDD
jgi:hypothetical protein